MERFIQFDKKNSFTDWGLILTSLDIENPEPKTNLVEIDGMDGSVDLSEALTGHITYRDRSLTASFWTCDGTRAEREILYRKIISYLHGRKVKITDPDDPYHYLIGRPVISDKDNNLAFLSFTVTAVCEPWRYAIEDSSTVYDLSRRSDFTAVLINHGDKVICPEIAVNGEVTIQFGDFVPVTLSDNTYKITDLKLFPGNNEIHLSGTGKIQFSYREGYL